MLVIDTVTNASYEILHVKVVMGTYSSIRGCDNDPRTVPIRGWVSGCSMKRGSYRASVVRAHGYQARTEANKSCHTRVTLHVSYQQSIHLTYSKSRMIPTPITNNRFEIDSIPVAVYFHT